MTEEEVTEPPVEENETASQPKEQITIDLDEYEGLKNEVAEYKDKYLRATAEIENQRKRLMRERDEILKHAMSGVIVEFLTPIDQMESALKFAENHSEDVKHWAHGFKMILNHFQDVLEFHGIKPIESVGQHFDPHFHHVAEVIETDEHEPGTILKETQKGYVRGDKSIRPAQVVIAKQPVIDKDKEETQND